MKRAALILMVFFVGNPVWAQADDEDDEQAAAAKAAGEAAKKAAEASKKTAVKTKTSSKKAKAKKKSTKAKPGKAGGVSFGALPSWDSAASAKKTKAVSPGHEMTANWDVATSPVAKVGYPWIEHHGAFRVRMDLLYNFDLDTYQTATRSGSSPFAPPLTEQDQLGNQHPESPNHRFGRGADSQSSANMRLRYQPTIHISDSLRIRTTLDFLDNVVLGSTPDGGPHTQRSLGSTADVLSRDDVPLEIVEDNQRPPESGVNSWRDSARVKRMWGEWQTPLGLVSVGRMPSHWGLGLIANDGNCLDCDFGDSVDRIMGVAKVFETYLAVSWDFPAEGLVGFSGTQNWRNQPAGQAYDFDQRDDANQLVIAIFRRPHSREELEARQRALNTERKPVFDWGVYNRIRSQSVESGYSRDLTPPATSNGFQLYEVDAFTYTPDLWLNFEYRPAKGRSYRIQFEGAATFGTIEEVPHLYAEPAIECVDPTETNLEVCDKAERRKRNIRRFGYAFQFDVQNDDITWGFHHGLASGDSTGGFGLLDRSEVHLNLPAGTQDSDLTAFRFDRDYHVDLIMFREMLGSVTNATYFKPYLRYNIVHEPTEAWGFQIASVFGYALEKDATPGRENPLGLEFDIELFVDEFDRFRWSLAYGAFFPMGAFNVLNQDGGVLAEPGVAQTFQMMFGFQF